MSDNLTVDLSGAPREALRGDYPRPGDVYRKAGGPPGFWWIVSCQQEGDVYALSMDMQGNINGSTRYAGHYFERNFQRRVGWIEMPSLAVQWDTLP
jgi:hypothetical protein